MAKIKNVKGRQVFDSRGNPTVEAEVFLDNGISATAISPSGASTGAFEAHELRDQNKNKFLGKSVNNAVENINNKISSKLKDLNSDDQSNLDNVLLKLDGTENKTNLGANATLAVSLANAKCSALSNKQSLFKNLGKSYSLPIPLMNIINGGAHADNDLNIQEFMIRPDSANNFMDAIEKCFLVIQNLKKLTSNYPIKSIEDPFAEDDWDAWKKITNTIGNKVQIVGDDLFVTNTKRLEKGIKEKSANSILVKPNQIGTLTETLEVITMAKKANLSTVISHRSGDTEDTFIADLAVATMSERVAKYNRLLRIEEELGNQVKMARI